MPYLKWISDDNLCIAVSRVLQAAQTAQGNITFGRNVIDPFSAMFEIAGFNMDYDTWVKSETSRQAQKTLQMHVGGFHQTILSFSKGWKDLKTGQVVDLFSKEKKIIAEIKNKHNTVKGSNLVDIYDGLVELVMQKSSIYKGYTAYFVSIIPKKPRRYDIPFIPSDNQKGAKRPVNEKIRTIDGASFYSMVTGDDSALENLFDALPAVISDCSKGKIKIKQMEKLKNFFNHAFEKP